MKENLELNCSIIFIISIYKVMFSSTLYIMNSLFAYSFLDILYYLYLLLIRKHLYTQLPFFKNET